MRPLLTAVVFLVTAQAGYGQSFNISRVVQSGDTPPGYATPFPATGNAFNGFPSVHSDGTVVFNGPVPVVPEQVNIFTGPGGGPLTRAVAYDTPIPGGGGATFQSLGSTPIINGSGIIFQGSSDTTASPAVQGIYRSSGGTITTLADKTTTAPGIGTAFTSFRGSQFMSASGSNIAFQGTTATGNGLYAHVGGSLSVIADLTTNIPEGTGQFTTLTNVALGGTTAAFRASGNNSQQGIYLRDVSSAGNPVVRVTDRTQVLPGTASTLITNMNEPAISGTDLYVSVSAGANTAKLARYAWNGSSSSPAFTPSVLAAAGDIAPGQTTATFSAFGGSVSADGSLVAFMGTFTGGTGIYLHDGTTLHRVIDTTQTLDGKPINSFLFGPDALSGDRITFHVTFADGATVPLSTRGIYVAQLVPVPEPGCVLLAAAVGLTGLAAVRRSRRAV